MKLTIIYPCDYFDKRKVARDYEAEFIEACNLNFHILLFDYDEFMNSNKMKFYPDTFEEGLFIVCIMGLKPSASSRSL